MNAGEIYGAVRNKKFSALIEKVYRQLRDKAADPNHQRGIGSLIHTFSLFVGHSRVRGPSDRTVEQYCRTHEDFSGLLTESLEAAVNNYNISFAGVPSVRVTN